MRRKFISIFLIMLLCINSTVFFTDSKTASAKTSADFEDLKDLDAATKAKFDELIEAGVFNGLSEGVFGPNDKMNRAQFAKVAAVIFGLDMDTSPDTSSFDDVPENYWAAPYIHALKSAGITDGVGDGRYNPTGEVTKQELATFLVRGLGWEKDAQATPGMNDPSVDDWAKGYVALAVEKKILTSGENGEFGGTSNATRSELVLATYEADKQYKLSVLISISSFQAIDPKTLVVKLNNSVDTSKAILSLTVPKESSTNWSLVWNDDKQATFTFNESMAEGDYIVQLSGLENSQEGEKTAKVTVTPEKVVKIEFDYNSDRIPHSRSIKLPFKLFNQYGQVVTSQILSSLQIGVNASVPAYIDTNSMAVIADTSSIKNNQLIYVVVSEHNSGISARKDLMVEVPEEEEPQIVPPVVSTPSAAIPAADIVSGAVDAGTLVSLSAAAGTSIYYTIDGSTPSASSTLYTAPISITEAVTIKAIAVRPGWINSSVLTLSYTIKPQAEIPTASVASGAVDPGTLVSLSAADGASIYYTTDGSAPSTSSTLYTAPISVKEAVTIKAIAVRPGWINSSVLTLSYTIKPQAEIPTASVASGAVDPGTLVSLSAADGASIYYTIDGSTPSASSTLYTAPISITEAVTIKAIAVKSGMTNSSLLTLSYTIKPQVAIPTADVASGAVDPGTLVSLSAADGASIYYTTDGSTPNSSSTLYTAPISITEAVTIKAIAVKSGMTNSSLLTLSYTIKPQVAIPTADVASGAVDPGTLVSLSAADGASIYYTTDGSTPSASSALYTAPISITEAVTIKAIAVKSGMTNSSVLTLSYTIKPQAAIPTASVTSGAVDPGTLVSLSAADGASIYYTTDGSVPSTSSTLYTAPISITEAVTIKAIAVKSGMTNSNVLTLIYTIKPQAAIPTANVASGAVDPGTIVSLSAADGASIYYTTDGSTPNSSSTLYTAPISITEAVTIKAIAVKNGMTNSSVLSLSYTIKPQAAIPTANVASGAVDDGTLVSLSAADGASIYYTTDGSTPSASSTLYTAPISITEAVTIKAIAVRPGWINSSVLSLSYTIKPQAEIPTASVANGAVDPGTLVSLSAADGASIYYTTDGSVPSTSSTLYTAPISITEAVTIKAIAVKSGMTNSSVLTLSYTIKPQAAIPTASVASGAVDDGTLVSLSAADGASIYYTTDGSVPSTSSTLYTAPISITEAVTIKAIAVKSGWINSQVASFEYTVIIPIVLPELIESPSSSMVGAVYYGFITASGGTGALTYSITTGQLPPGLALDPNTGEITGTPAASGTYSFTISVTDSATTPVTASMQYILTIDQQIPPTVTALYSSQTTVTLPTAGLTHKLAITANFDNYTSRDVTAEAQYVSNNESIATVSAAGVVTAVGSGTASITVTYGGLTKTVTVTVSTTLQLDLLDAFLASNPMRVGETTNFIVTTIFIDGLGKDEAFDALDWVTIEIADPDVVSIDENYFVTALKSGSTTIKVSFLSEEVFITLDVL